MERKDKDESKTGEKKTSVDTLGTERKEKLSRRKKKAWKDKARKGKQKEGTVSQGKGR